MIYFQDNTIRDGMQQRAVNKSIAIKKQIIDEISRTRINSVEIGMCDSLQDLSILSEYMNILRKDQNGVVLTRLMETSIDLGTELHSKYSNTVLKLLVPISKMHIEEKLKTEKTIYFKRLERILKYSQQKELNIDIVLEDSTRANKQVLFEVLSIVSNYKIGFVTLADTVGCATPTEYGYLFKEVRGKFPKLKLSAHCHNDLGLATANTISAIINGATQVETTFLGIGERAGNTSIEEVVAVLYKKELNETELNLKSIYKTSNKIREILEYEIPPTKPIIGSNIFVHESGIHQDGTLKNIEMYQYILPSELGIPNSTNYSISGISSKKILYQYFKNIVGSEIDVDDLIQFYRHLSKVTDKLTPENCLELYQFREREKNGNIRS